MGSRRTMARSSSGNGRSSNGDDISGNSRPGGCSYLSNVRPENRSTLCSVIAQLTEETQPCFEKTLKSKAVSENCNVKFSCVVTGYPAPQVIWYKDDMQLDRYCGLPKYEIFHSGQNHSLHIYNCTVEDAAMYQASASNAKGIVSCSGVLEVGEMNEFKIHQRYFAKVKQKAENKRREVTGKENQEPLRTISPDRSQRKRRSAVEAFLSTSSSEGSEESQEDVTMNSEARIQGPTVEQADERPVSKTNGAVSAVTNGQFISENGSKGGTYIYDSAQKSFTAHQPQTPFVKKKIKISSSSNTAKTDTLGERMYEDRRSKEATSTCITPTCKEAVQGNSEEDMEVERSIHSPVLDPDFRNVAEPQLKPASLVGKDKKMSAAPSQKEQLTASVSACTSTKATGTEGKQNTKHGKEGDSKRTGENVEMQSSIKAPPKLLSTVMGDINKTEDVIVMDVDEKSSARTLSSTGPESVDTQRESRTVWPQHLREQIGDQQLEKETSPCQKNAFVPRPALPAEVTQAHTKMNRNDAPVNLELAADQCLLDIQPPKRTTSEGETIADDIQTPSVNRGLQAAIVKMTQDTRHHSSGSNESHTALFTDPQKSPLESPSGVKNTQRCNVSSTDQHSQADTAIKYIEGTEIHVKEQVEGNVEGKLAVQVSRKEKKVEMVAEIAATQTVKESDILDKDADVTTADATNKERENKGAPLKVKKETSSELQNVKQAVSQLKNPPKNANLFKQPIEDFQEITKPVTRVISVAELLRSQIKALDSIVANSLPTLPIPTDLHPPPANVPEREDEIKCKLELRTSIQDNKTETSTDNVPLRTIKDTLMEIYHHLYKSDQEEIKAHDQTSHKPLEIPPIAATDTGNPAHARHHSTTSNEAVEHETSAVGPSKGHPVVTLSEIENVKNNFVPMTSKEELTKRLIASSNRSGNIYQEPGISLTVTPVKDNSQESRPPVSAHAENGQVQGKNMESEKKSAPEIKLNSDTQGSNSEILFTTLSVSDQCKMEEANATITCLQHVQECPTKTVLGTDTQGNSLQVFQQGGSMAEEFQRTDSLTNLNPETSPLLKRRNCVSPIPSATPQELASGARRKILAPKIKPEEDTGATPLADDQAQKNEVFTQSSTLSSHSEILSTSPSFSRQSPLLQPPDDRTAPVEKRSPLPRRRKTTSETQAPSPEPSENVQNQRSETKPAEKDKRDPRKAPQVIRKIRSETFADASGHLKLWCQFFNILSDSTIKWYRNQVEIAQIKRNAADESQVNLAIVQASSKDSGVYKCTITNEYGTDSTDFLLGSDTLSGISLREDVGVGEEIEMTPLVFSKGVADSGNLGNKFFGRIMMQKSCIGDGFAHKVLRAKVIYGLEPVFESGNTCIIKACNPIAYGGKEERCLIDRNLDSVRQECKIQNLAREYCKIFSAEARVAENFGPSLEIIPVYLMYRPANTIPYATVEADLTGVYQKYAVLDDTGRIEMRSCSEVEQKCCALQHWIFQWTNGNLLLTRLEGVDTKITNVGITVKSTGHHGLSVEGNPKVFEQFVSLHQCNYFCGLLGLRSLKVLESLMMPTKPKGSKSPLLQRKMATGSSSPLTGRKAAGSPKLPRKTEQDSSSLDKKLLKLPK